MKKVLYILNDCMRKFSYERAVGLYRALKELDEPASLHIVRSDAYSGFVAEHNIGEYNIYRLPDYRDYDCILLDINSIFTMDGGAQGMQYVVEAAARSGKPVISMVNRLEGFHYIGIDNYASMSAVIRHLHREKGLTDFWFALGPADNYENQERTRALRDYCAENGLPCGEERFYAESFIIECGIHAFEQLYARHGGAVPQAVICANDHIALGICLAAAEKGLHVPTDFYVTGFDNTELSVSASPTLTTVDQQRWKMGDVCVDAMRRIWRGEAVPEQITIPTKLMLRESSGSPAAAPLAPEPQEKTAYLGGSSSDTDFNYKLSSMQYRFPNCDSVEEICRIFTECLTVLNCNGVDLVLDRRLFEPERSIGFREQNGQMRDLADGFPVEGYADSLELFFTWRAGREAHFPRRRVGGDLRFLCPEEVQENCLFAPLHFMERTVGYLCVHNCLELIRIKGVSTAVSTLSMALRTYFTGKNLAYINSVLSGISMKDGMTGLYNRLGYHELAYTLFRETTREGKPLAILFMDLDGLKQINDCHGHAVGDLAIKCVADTILRLAPQDAICVRYGGDEFLMLVPDLEAERTEALLLTFQACLAEEARVRAIPSEVDVSSGFLITEPQSTKQLDEYVREADARMYRVKKAKKAARA